MGRYLVCVTGASGSVYGLRVASALIEAGHEVHAIFSPWGARVMLQETGEAPESWSARLGLSADRVYAPDNLAAPPSSGTFRLDGTVIVPCSMSTLGALASGAAANLVHRAGGVALKEGRPLILVPREAPLSLVDLRNMTALAEAGATILPASPGFYHKPTTVDQLVDFVAGKILDRLGLGHRLFEPWDGRQVSP
ncbi:MAG: UbiX family flavin prenyltransferase [Spirochaetota bacterium]